MIWELESSQQVQALDESAAADQADEGEENYEEYVQQSVLSGHGGWVWDCDITCDNSFTITVSTDNKVRIWRNGKAEIRKVLEGHSKGITCLAFRDATSNR